MLSIPALKLPSRYRTPKVFLLIAAAGIYATTRAFMTATEIYGERVDRLHEELDSLTGSRYQAETVLANLSTRIAEARAEYANIVNPAPAPRSGADSPLETGGDAPAVAPSSSTPIADAIAEPAPGV